MQQVPGWAAALAMVMVCGIAAPNTAEAGCRINLSVKNGGEAKLSVQNVRSETGVKTKGGHWRALKTGSWLNAQLSIDLVPGQKVGSDYKAALGCALKRRYRIRYACKAGANKHRQFTKYYPSATGLTGKQTLTITLDACK